MSDIVEYLFSQRKEVGRRLARHIFKQGYSKKSFAEYVGISIPTFDKLLKGEVNSTKMFEKCLRQVTRKLNIGMEELIGCQVNDNSSAGKEEDIMKNGKVNKLFDLLDNLLVLCEIYYPPKEI